MADDEEDWSADDLRSDHECEEHWMLRREFIIRNKGRFPKLRLLSLSQVFTNMEFLGCKYPEETMALVAEMSEGIVEEYRTKQSSRLQRNFIKASSAAEAKSKGSRSSKFNPFTPVISSICDRDRSKSKNFNRRVPGPNTEVSSFSESVPLSLRYSLNTSDLNGLVLVEQLFLPEDTPKQLIHRSCQMSGKSYNYFYNADESECTCTFRLGNFELVGKGPSKEAAKNAVAAAVVEKLKKICHTIQVKTQVNGASIRLHELKNGKAEADDSSYPSLIDESNVGSKLLRLMGWTGGGLGKNENGIQAPIDVSDSIGRSRLGFGSAKEDGKVTSFTSRQAEDFLRKEFLQAAHSKELIFSSEFSKEERGILHTIAHRLHLRSKSYGKGDKRVLVISQKITLPALLQQIISSGESEKYRVIFPTNTE